MPLYDYQCNHCETIFEVRASFNEKESGLHPECPECHDKETHQILTAGMLLRVNGDGAVTQMPACGPSAGPGCCG